MKTISKGNGIAHMSAFLAQGQRFLGLDDAQADPDRAGVILAPVPFEATSSYGHGSRGGPAAILAASHQVELRDCDFDGEPWAIAGGIATLCPLPVEDGDDGRTVMGRLDRVVTDWLDRGKTVVCLTGEHTGSVGAMRAHARLVRDLTVVQIDAHSDLRAAYLGDPWNHACTMARVLDFHDRIVQVGIRSESPEDAAVVQERRIPVFRAAGIHRDDARRADWVAPIVEACSANVYVTLDCDALDPSVIPATGTPEPGGLDWAQINRLLERLCRDRRVVGFDLTELAPIPGLRYPEFTAAKLVSRFIGWMTRSHRRD